MAIIKQLKQFITGLNIYPITKTNAVYDDTIGRLDTFMEKSVTESDVLENENTLSGVIRNLMNPFSGNFIFPVTKASAVYHTDGTRVDKIIDKYKERHVSFDSSFSLDFLDVRMINNLIVFSCELSDVTIDDEWTSIAYISDDNDAYRPRHDIYLSGTVDTSDKVLEVVFTTEGLLQARVPFGLENSTIRVFGCGFMD